MKAHFGLLILLLVFAACRSEDPESIGQISPPPAPQAAAAPDVGPAQAPPPPPQAPLPPPVKPSPAPTPPPPPPLPPPKPIVRHFPIDGPLAAVAFEDWFPFPSDEDFNDFLTDFHITEKGNDLNQLTNIIIDFYPRAVGGSFDHSFLIVLKGKKDQPSNITAVTKPLFNGDATVTLTHYDADGQVIGQPERVDPNHDITIFESTHALFDKDPRDINQIINTYADSQHPYKPPLESVRLSIQLLEPEKNVVGSDQQIDLSQFRMILHVRHILNGKRQVIHHTRFVHGRKIVSATPVPDEDIDIIDVVPSAYTRPEDKRPYPFGFIIGKDWRWPQEGKKIDAAYPSFEAYRDYLTKPHQAGYVKGVTDWYKLQGVEAFLYPSVPDPKLLPDP